MDIKKYIKECHAIAISKGFYDCPECGQYPSNSPSYETLGKSCNICNNTGINQNRNIGEILMLIVSELSEALEVHRNNKFANMIDFNIVRTKEWTRLNSKLFENHIKDTFEDELADVFIRLFDLCGYLKIEKLWFSMKYNNCYKGNNIAEWLFHINRSLWTIYKYHTNKTNSEQAMSNTVKYLIYLCEYLNIPIEKHIQAKMAYNKIRPYKHNKEY